MVTQGGLLKNEMIKINCPRCGAVIYGKPVCNYDERGNLIQLIDLSCTCGYGRIHDPRMKL